jgi:hypothetical protein
MRNPGRILLAAVVTVTLAHSAVAQEAGGEVAAAQPLAGRARLKITADAAAVAAAATVPVAERQHRIEVRVTRSDDGSVLTGPVTIKGVPAVASADVGDVDWQVSESTVSGTVRHSATAATTFQGTLNAEGASGTFTLPNGARGEWAWDGPLPK